MNSCELKFWKDKKNEMWKFIWLSNEISSFIITSDSFVFARNGKISIHYNNTTSNLFYFIFTHKRSGSFRQSANITVIWANVSMNACTSSGIAALLPLSTYRKQFDKKNYRRKKKHTHKRKACVWAEVRPHRAIIVDYQLSQKSCSIKEIHQ